MIDYFIFLKIQKAYCQLYRKTLRTLARENCETHFYGQSEIIFRKAWHTETRKNFYQEIKK